MFNFEDLLPVLFIAYTLLLLLVIVLFFVHRRNNKKQLRLLEEKFYNLTHETNQQQHKQFDTFKQGLQQLINDLSKRIKSNEHRLADVINQLDEMQSMSATTEDEAKVTKTSEKDLTRDLES